MNFAETLADMANQQDGDTAHDAIVYVDIGGGNINKYRGMIHVEEDTVSVLPTLYGVPNINNGVACATRWPDHEIPRNAEWSGHAEVPMHIRLNSIVMVEWAVNDYS